MLDFAAEAARYRRELQDDILPWWLRHAIDHQHGGLCSCIRDDGVIVSRDKFIWSQVRGLWTFAAAHNRIQARQEYLDCARGLFDFCAKFGRSAEGDWLFRVDERGRVLEGARSIQTDAFAICALVEYARADPLAAPRAIEMANQGFERTLSRIRRPGSYETAPYPIPAGGKAQRVSMQFSLAYFELGKLTGDPRVLEAALELCDDVLDHFRRPDLRACLEYLTLDNSLLPPPAGTYISAGHGIETAWFQIENLRSPKPAASRRQDMPPLPYGDPTRLSKALDIMRWSFERGWDHEHGGLLLGGDLHGGTPYLPHSDTKIWWPQCEALCGLLMAYEVSRDPQFLEWYTKTRDWAYARFPDREHGEWTQRLDPTGTKKLDTVVALPVKDPFHLPRALIYAVETLERLADPEPLAA